MVLGGGKGGMKQKFRCFGFENALPEPVLLTFCGQMQGSSSGSEAREPLWLVPHL